MPGSDQGDKVLGDKVVEDSPSEKEVSIRQQHAPGATVDGEESEIQFGAGATSHADDSTEGGASPKAENPSSQLASTMAMMAQAVTDLAAKVQQLEAQLAPPTAPAAVAEKTSSAAAPPATASAVMGHVPHNVSTAGLSKFGGRDTSGDISDWVFRAKTMLPMMTEAGPAVEVDRINLILKALEGQARAVVDGECTKALISGKILTALLCLPLTASISPSAAALFLFTVFFAAFLVTCDSSAPFLDVANPACVTKVSRAH